MSDDSEFVLVMDISVDTADGKTRTHTIRPHEKDTIGETEAGDMRLSFGHHKDRDGRDLPGNTVTLPSAHVVEMTQSWRWERRIRLTPAEVVDRKKAEVAALAIKLGVDKPKP